MDLQERINLMVQLGEFMVGESEDWQQAIELAYLKNKWFIPKFTRTAVSQIVHNFLEKDKLQAWAAHYFLDNNTGGKKIGIVMAGNLPLVGFHDFLCCFICGHTAVIKLSSNDEILFKAIAQFLRTKYAATDEYLQFADLLKDVDAYIATGSNNTSRYFEYYFSKYPHIIRKNRTSVAVLSGEETIEELSNLTDDIHLYFGMGCRNVTKIFVPQDYNFEALLQSFTNYDFFTDHDKFKNNYDYRLSVFLLSRMKYMSSNSCLLVENESNFSPISVLHYQYYDATKELPQPAPVAEIQALVGKAGIPFGEAQQPRLMQYADGIDTMQFLLEL